MHLYKITYSSNNFWGGEGEKDSFIALPGKGGHSSQVIIKYLLQVLFSLRLVSFRRIFFLTRHGTFLFVLSLRADQEMRADSLHPDC